MGKEKSFSTLWCIRKICLSLFPFPPSYVLVFSPLPEAVNFISLYIVAAKRQRGPFTDIVFLYPSVTASCASFWFASLDLID